MQRYSNFFTSYPFKKLTNNVGLCSNSYSIYNKNGNPTFYNSNLIVYSILQKINSQFFPPPFQFSALSGGIHRTLPPTLQGFRMGGLIFSLGKLRANWVLSRLADFFRRLFVAKTVDFETLIKVLKELGSLYKMDQL